jgi:tRNA-specific 2-thiouridylase
LSQTYWDQVFADFLAEYRRGRTPNPDVLCNREIKFKAFLACARAQGGDLIATGHYARNCWRDDAWQLLRGADPDKDQSYFLYTLGQEQLATVLFPVGATSKRAVRAEARAAGLATHEKKDSTGICFIGERRFREFLSRYVAAAPGPIETLDGTVIGTHHGAIYYTLGQRQGLGIGGVRGAAELPWFVARKDLTRNALIVVQGTTHPALYARRLLAHEVVWVRGQAPALATRLLARTRHRQAVQACTVSAHGAAGVEVEFDLAQRAVTPGQSVVFYADQTCLGGGIIDATAIA